MTDAVFVTGLSIHAYHGVMQHEARVGQSFGLDLVLDTDLTGASRKRFIDKVSPASPDQRLGGSIAAHVLAAADGAAIIRAHDVAETVQALRVAAAIEAAR